MRVTTTTTTAIIIIIIMMMMMIVITIIVIIIVIIALKCAIREFLQSPYCAANSLNTYAQVTTAQSCTHHVQHIGLSSRTACRVPHGTRDSSFFAFFLGGEGGSFFVLFCFVFLLFVCLFFIFAFFVCLFVCYMLYLKKRFEMC